ncbi:MAG: hypothetical protein U9N39_08830 [Campylobacterota bacterium]|nr:hypothetical protein [Campylobacterota bacterium]
MKQLLTLFVTCLALLANPLQEVASSFSPLEREQLLKELGNSSLSSSKPTTTYKLLKGWNHLLTPIAGIDVKKTFKDSSKIKFVVTYDRVSKLWAIYAPEHKYPEGEILFLKNLEPDVAFFVLANDETTVKTVSKRVDAECRKYLNDNSYSMITDSGISKESEISREKNIAIRSRYFSHNERGLYDETRVMLIYPKLTSKAKRSYKYGPASPKVALEFTKKYEEKKFYIYDYKQEKCFEGVFPSIKIPPFPILKEI